MIRDNWIAWLGVMLLFGFLMALNYADHDSRELWKGNPGPYLCHYFHHGCAPDAGAAAPGGGAHEAKCPCTIASRTITIAETVWHPRTCP